MRAAPVTAVLLAWASTSAVTAPSGRPLISVAWPAPVGHFQPRAGDILIGIPLSSSSAEQEALDRALDKKLKICRGC